MKLSLSASLTIAALALTACPPGEKTPSPPSSGGSAAPAAPAAPAVPTSTVSATGGAVDGKQVYMQFCVTCHGPDGSGAMMRQMLPKIGDLTSPETHGRLKDEDIAALVRTGRDKMPAFGTLMKPEQVDAVVSYVRTLKKG